MGLYAGHATQRHFMIRMLVRHPCFEHAIYPQSAADAACAGMAKLKTRQRVPYSPQLSHRVSRAQSGTSDDLVSIADGAQAPIRRDHGA